ncbi:hypothetical protein OUZ56_026165 [Daphnia magna]|uniref:Endonuclease/exonuclease/phosphatase domain-containing protein n=1 Tax=Daphnia magna TaxID=35525 RepID=A0ABQ9ZKY9_9CRUS|nr:hypothetical protein OUZ56_026165 [Daphnia magna]
MSTSWGLRTNAKSSLWNSVTTDRKEMDLEEILLVGTSFLDITLGTDDIVTPHWFFPTFPSLSDHPFIYYEIMRATSPCSARLLKAPSPKLPNITKLDVLHLRSLVSMGLSHTPLPTLACSKSEVDSSISGLVSLFFSLVRKAKKKDDPTPTRLMP